MMFQVCFQAMLILFTLLLTVVVNSMQIVAEAPEPTLQIADIVLNHEYVEDGSRKSFANPALAFVTPWNPVGYDWAKLYGRKFSHISPVWFQLVVGDGPCSVHGAHDIDQDWLADVRQTNPDVLIVPRVLVQYTDSKSAATRFITVEEVQNECFKDLINFVQRNRFDGIVFEYYLQTLSKQKQMSGILQIAINLGELLKMNNLQFLLVLPPCAPNVGDKSLFASKKLHRIKDVVDYVIVMTYDYPLEAELARGRLPPLSPIPWVQRCMESLKSQGTGVKLMMGLNFYGYLFSKQSPGVKTVVGSAYLQELNKGDAQLKWDQHVAEHFTLLHGGNSLTNYPSTATIEARCRLAQQLGIGLAVWDLGQGLAHFLNYL